MKIRGRSFMWAVVCMLLLPAAAFGGGVVIAPCSLPGVPVTNSGSETQTRCALAGGGSANYTGRAISGVNSFLNIISPVLVESMEDQSNTFIMTIQSFPTWTVAGPVSTSLSLTGTVEILQPGATVDILLTGRLGGPFLEIRQHFAATGSFSVTVAGLQGINSVATTTLTVTINGNATFNSPGSAEFAGAVPEPATMLLLATGLAGFASVYARRKTKKPPL